MISNTKWLPPHEVSTRAVLQLTLGISEHSGRYDRFARFLAENGYQVYACDLRGQGLSGRQSELGKASVHFWVDTIADMKQLLDLIYTENPNLPRFAFGHSLGSALTQSHIQNWGGMFKGGHPVWHVWSLSRNERHLITGCRSLKALAFAAETSDKTSAVFVELLSNLNKACGPDFKGCDWQTTDQVEIERFLRDPLNGSFHPTPPGSSSLLQVSINSEEVQSVPAF